MPITPPTGEKARILLFRKIPGLWPSSNSYFGLSYGHTELTPPRTVPDPIRGDPWLDLSRIRSAAVMVLGGLGWSWKVLDGPGKSGRSFLKF